ncbi:MAG: hypothetical protein EBS05_24705, partial [Proteobacteria bacterium]|nr:hypothetical protein [Pseudomonadota bacterium]
MPRNNRIFRKEGEKEVIGTYLHAFIHNGDYFLSEIKVFADGMVDCWELVDFETFKQKVRSGWVVTQLPENARVSISSFVSFTACEVRAFIDQDEFIKQVADEIEELNSLLKIVSSCNARTMRRVHGEHGTGTTQTTAGG